MVMDVVGKGGIRWQLTILIVVVADTKEEILVSGEVEELRL